MLWLVFWFSGLKVDVKVRFLLLVFSIGCWLKLLFGGDMMVVVLVVML